MQQKIQQQHAAKDAAAAISDAAAAPSVADDFDLDLNIRTKSINL